MTSNERDMISILFSNIYVFMPQIVQIIIKAPANGSMVIFAGFPKPDLTILSTLQTATKLNIKA